MTAYQHGKSRRPYSYEFEYKVHGGRATWQARVNDGSAQRDLKGTIEVSTMGPGRDVRAASSERDPSCSRGPSELISAPVGSKSPLTRHPDIPDLGRVANQVWQSLGELRTGFGGGIPRAAGYEERIRSRTADRRRHAHWLEARRSEHPAQIRQRAATRSQSLRLPERATSRDTPAEWESNSRAVCHLRPDRTPAHPRRRRRRRRRP